MPRMTRKGQVTIPPAVRRLLGIKTGDEISFEIRDGRVSLSRKISPSEGLEKYVGFFAHLKGRDPDDVIDEIRGKADDFSC